MSDVRSPCEAGSDIREDAPKKMQRARGRVEVAGKLRDGKTVLDRLYQAGSAKAHLPGTETFEAVLLNTAGGATGGDDFRYAVAAGAGTHVTATTQAAERIYRSTGAEAEITNTLTLGRGARLDWLPQETILFEGGRLSRRLTVEMPADATLLAIEPLVLGRTAMRETVETGSLADRWRVRRAGRLIYADALRLSGAVATARGHAATLGGGLACASLLYVAPDAEDRLDAVRNALHSGGASAWDGMLAARVVAEDGAALRRAVLPMLAVLRGGPMPRVWNI